MKINHKILSIPPYISTSWRSIVSLQAENRQGISILSIELISGTRILIPNLDKETLDHVFACHADHLEEQESLKRPITFSLPLPLNLPGTDTLAGLLQHNPEQAETPPLPPELLEKVSSLAKTMGGIDSSVLPAAEPHCNCPHCQIMRALAGDEPQSTEEEVTEEDLKFRTWDIAQESDKLFTVTNPLDTKEHYNVFLGEPLGCTCGQKNCEHIQAVLKT